MKWLDSYVCLKAAIVIMGTSVSELFIMSDHERVCSESASHSLLIRLFSFT